MPFFLTKSFLDCTNSKIMIELERITLEAVRVNTKSGNSEKMIEGSMMLIGLSEAAHLYALFLKKSFHECANLMAVLFMAALLFVLAWHFFTGRKAKRTKMVSENGFLKLMHGYPLLCLLTGGLIIFQIIWNYYMHVPYLKNDITGETVQTMLASDGIYTVNPMTGFFFEEGMPLRLRILCLPTLYAAVCRFTGIPAQTLVYSIVPMLVLLLSYLVYSRYAAWFFPKEEKKQLLFMLFVVLLYQLGSYGTVTDSFFLFFRGFQGAAYRACVILPYALLCSLKGKWKSVILCALAEVCVVWTFYGLGYTVIVAGVVLSLKGIQTFLEAKKNTGKEEK